MLLGFYDYLAERTIEYFINNDVFSGEKFILQLDSHDDVKVFNRVLKEKAQNLSLIEEFIYPCDENTNYKSYCLLGKKCRILIAVQDGQNVTMGYLTTLRNLVGKRDYKNYAALMVCYDRLDSIEGGCDSFRDEGMPFHCSSIIKGIEDAIKNLQFTPADRMIIQNSLKSYGTGVYQDNTTLYEFQHILDMITRRKIEKEDFGKLDLFYDPDIYTITDESALKYRVEENKKYHIIIENSLKYGEPEKDLCNDFQDKFIEDLNKTKESLGEWDEGLTFSDIERARKKKAVNDIDLMINDHDIVVRARIDENIYEELENFVRSESDTKLKKKYKHILIFNPKGFKDVEIEINANKDLINLKIDKIGESIEIKQTTGRKRKTICISHNHLSFGRVDFSLRETNEKFRICFCIIDTDKQLLEGIETAFLIKGKINNFYLSVICNGLELCFNPKQNNGETIFLEDNMTIVCDDNKYIKICIDENRINDSEEISALLEVSEECMVPLRFETESLKISEITGIAVEKRKLYERDSFKYNENNKLSCGSYEYFATENFRINLLREQEIVRSKEYSYEIIGEELQGSEFAIPDTIRLSYLKLLEGFEKEKILPSLAYYDGTLRDLAQDYVDTVNEYLDLVIDGMPLEQEVRNVLRLGTIIDSVNDTIILTSVHPLNVSYRLLLYSQKSTEELRDDMIKRLSQYNLIPYITDDLGRLYRIVDQTETPEWTYYSRVDYHKDDGSKKFVSSVICEKIEEFEEHFLYMFPFHENPIIINLINMGDCREVFAGILKYYGSQRKEVQSELELRPIVLNLYDKEQVATYFDLFMGISISELSEKVKMIVGEKVKGYRTDELIAVASRKLRIFSRNINEESLAYAHLTFFEMESNNAKEISLAKDIKSSVMMEGLQSGTSSEFYGRNYRTGFGTKNATIDNTLMSLTRLYNSLYEANGSSNPYNKDACIATEIGIEDLNYIDKVYQSSNWVVFIDPKVDLNFFKNGESNRNVIIIHYSDQYTTTSGYDAITVTRKCEQYEKILTEILGENGIKNPEQYTLKLIDLFNAINGNWLLNLVSSKNISFTKEKISLLSAVKFLLAYLQSDNIIWVPISLEEILRVSGAVGLPKSEGVFSVKSLGFSTIGDTCDDILMVGIKLEDQTIKVCFHPTEVKIGQSPDIEKAMRQVGRTYQLLEKTVGTNEQAKELKFKFYRNFLMQLVIISAEKMDLYNVWPTYEWKRLTNTEIRERLLNDDFEIVTDFEDIIGKGTVISFKKSAYTRSLSINNNMALVELLYQDGYMLMTKEVDEISDLLKITTIDQRLLLKNQLGKKKISEEGQTGLETNKEIQRTMKIEFGKDQITGDIVYWFPNDSRQVMHLNTGIIGTSGTGKTQFTKSLVYQLMKESKYNVGAKNIGILIFDYKGDYNNQKVDFVKATHANVLELYHLPYNPFSLSEGQFFRPLLPLRVADTFKDTLAKAYGLGVKQSSLLSDLIVEAYKRKGIQPEEPDTWAKEAPTFSDVYKVYMERDDIKKDDSLYSALSEIQKYRIFEDDVTKTKNLYDIIDGVIVINLAGQNRTLQNLIVAITLDLFYLQMQCNGHSILENTMRQINKFILVDEADNFLHVGYPSLKNILKEGREYGVGMILSTQFLKHFDTEGEDYSSYILTWIVHNIADFSPKNIKSIFAEDQKSRLETLCSEIKKLQPHYSFVKIGNLSETRMIQDRAFFEIMNEEREIE